MTDATPTAEERAWNIVQPIRRYLGPGLTESVVLHITVAMNAHAAQAVAAETERCANRIIDNAAYLNIPDHKVDEIVAALRAGQPGQDKPKRPPLPTQDEITERLKTFIKRHTPEQ